MNAIIPLEVIKGKIYLIRSQKVLLDNDLASLYATLNNSKIVHILRRLSDTYMTSKMENITISCPLSVEHILPQQWVDKWPLKDGQKGMSIADLWTAEPSDLCAVATRRRNSMLQTFGNLTILTQALNSSVSNGSWIDKKPELMRYSLLPINQQLHEADKWDEEGIAKRGEALLEKALKLWPRDK